MVERGLGMGYRTTDEVLDEAKCRGLRKALFVTALPIELDAVRAHPTHR